MPHRKGLHSVLVGLLILLLTACSGAASTPPLPWTLQPTDLPALSPAATQPVQPSATPAATQTATQIATRTPTPVKPTRTPAPTATSAVIDPSPSAWPALVWGPAMPPPLTLERYAGVWSPTANEMAAIYPIGSEGNEAVTVATAPDFLFRPLVVEPPDWPVGDFGWTPDGRRVFVGVWYTYYGDLWTVDRSGEASWPVAPEAEYSLGSEDMHLAGWANERSVLVADYSGGGHWRFELVDYLSGQVQRVGGVHGSMFAPRAGYIPVVDHPPGPMILYVVGEQAPPPDVEIVFVSSYGRRYPTDQIPQFFDGLEWHEINTYFEGWVPQANALLFLGFQWQESSSERDNWLTTTQLLRWNLATDQLDLIVPNSADARFSPDGRLLAATTLGPVQIDAQGRFSAALPTQLERNAPPTLHLLDWPAQTVRLSLPVLAEYDPFHPITGYAYPDYRPAIAFSPNSRYLAFVSPIPLRTDPEGGVLTGNADTPANPQLHVLDLQTNQIVWSGPGGYFVPVWSPESDRLVYLDPAGNWQLLDLPSGSAVAITASGGQRLTDPAWSFQGSYLSFWVQAPEYQGYIRRYATAILLVEDLFQK